MKHIFSNSRRAALVATVSLPTFSLFADTVVTSDYHQDGGVYDVSPPTLIVADSSHPTLTLSNQAEAAWNGAAIIGYRNGTQGNLELSGGSTINTLSPGGGSAGYYDGRYLSNGTVYLGLSTGSVGRVHLSGENTKWESNGFDVGYGGTGTMLIENGAEVSKLTMIRVGYLEGSYGLVSVSGAGSLLAGGGAYGPYFYVGDYGNGTLNITNEGRAATSSLTVGANERSVGRINIHGSGSELSYQYLSNLFGKAEIHVQEGGKLVGGRFSSATIRTNSDITVEGRGSSWSYDSLNIMAGTSVAQFSFKDGATVTGSTSVMGAPGNERVTIDVSGADTVWNAGALTLHSGGNELLSVTDGAEVTATSVDINGTKARYKTSVVTISGDDSALTASGLIRVGREGGKAELRVTDGGFVSAASGVIAGGATGAPPVGSGKIVVMGAQSGLQVSGGLEIGSVAQGTLQIAAGGQVNVGGNIAIFSRGKLDLSVTGNSMLTAGGLSFSGGTLRIAAAAGLAGGTYTPISSTGGWNESVAATQEIYGGVWDHVAKQFIVAEAEAAISGEAVSLDLNSSRRLRVEGANGDAYVAFSSTAEAEGGGEVISFEATELDFSDFSFAKKIYGAWEFDTDLADGVETMLSFQIGAEADRDRLAIWHSEDGLNWSFYDSQVLYDGEMATFFVNGFSSYAVAIPEPGSGLLFTGAAACLYFFRRRRS